MLSSFSSIVTTTIAGLVLLQVKYDVTVNDCKKEVNKGTTLSLYKIIMISIFDWRRIITLK